jgi:hypothetical protein
MAGIGASLEKVITGAAKGLANLQIGINKILWGSANTQPIASAKFDLKTGQVQYTVTSTVPKPPPPKKNILQTGLFNVLDTLNSVDLCNVLTYAYDNINIKKKPRPPQETWTPAQRAFYGLQDQAFTVQVLIDKYTAYPNILVASYLNSGIQPITNKEAVDTFGAPQNSSDISGTSVEKLLLFNLILAIKDVFQREADSALNKLFTPEERAIISVVPGLAVNLNLLDDFLGSIDKYIDYREISNADLIKLQKKIVQVRAICVTIQTLNIKSGLALVGNIVGVDIRAQFQRLSQFMNPADIAKVVRQVVGAVRSFIRIATKVQNVLKQAQFIIKIALLVIKVFRFVKSFLLANPLPSLFTTAGIQTAFDQARQFANDTTVGLVKLLKEVNALLSVVLIFVRYLLANANELLRRLEILLLSLEACDAMKDSDIIKELKDSIDELRVLRDQLATYVTQYDSKTSKDKAYLGKYEIKVVEEEVTERSVTNKRRRGIALDDKGFIVTQSDLTFATNTAIIIEEVKIKLISAGLIQPSLATLDGTDLAVVSTSLDYLDSNDVLSENFNLDISENLDTPDNEDETKGTGLNAFINKLPGGRRLRKRTRASLDAASEKLGSQISGEGQLASSALNFAGNTASSVGTGNEPGEAAQKTENPRQKRRNR